MIKHTINCKLTHMGEIQQLSIYISKRVMRVTTLGDFPQVLSFDIFEQSFGLLFDYHKDDAVILEFKIQGREYTNKQGVSGYFNNLIITGIKPFK